MYKVNIAENFLLKQFIFITVYLRHEILPLTLSTFNNDKRPISSGKCVKQFERNETILKLEQLPIYSKPKFNKLFLFEINLLTLAGIDWIWLWSNVRNCRLCNKPILVGMEVKLLNDKCNSTNDDILNNKNVFLID
jgi:hypothetical protein